MNEVEREADSPASLPPQLWIEICAQFLSAVLDSLSVALFQLLEWQVYRYLIYSVCSVKFWGLEMGTRNKLRKDEQP